MKKSQKRILMTLLLAAMVGQANGQTPRVDLYLKADIQSRLVTSTTLSDPRLGQATPVMDEAKAALGWHIAEWSEPVLGYVPDAKIGKDMLPVDDTPIYAEASDTSQVIATYEHGRDTEIVDTGLWWKIRYGGGIPVYFVLDTPPPLPPVTGIADAPAAPAADATAGDVIFTDTSPGMAGGSSSIVLREKDKPLVPDAVTLTYDGVLRPSKRGLGLFAPKAPYFLEGPDRERIAWIDTGGIVLPGSIKDFLNKWVIINGERTQLSGSGEWIIRARSMRLKQ